MLDNINMTDAAQAGGEAVGFMGVVWWVIKGAHRRIDNVEKDITDAKLDITKTNLDIANYKAYAEGNYIKTSSLDRVHERIDALGLKMDALINLILESRNKS